MAPSPSISKEAPSPLIRFRDGCRAGNVVTLPGLCANVGNPTAPGGKDFPGVTPLADRLGGNGAIYILDFVSLAEGVCGPLSVEDLAAHALPLVSASGGVDAYVGYSFGASSRSRWRGCQWPRTSRRSRPSSSMPFPTNHIGPGPCG